MKTLQFTNPVFHTGRNITCRRGIKWAFETEAAIKGFGTVRLSPVVIRFSDITDSMVADEQEPACRSVEGLLTIMRRVYHGFTPKEIVTLVEFHLKDAVPTPQYELGKRTVTDPVPAVAPVSIKRLFTSVEAIDAEIEDQKRRRDAADVDHPARYWHDGAAFSMQMVRDFFMT